MLVFPARAGMSLPNVEKRCCPTSFPRASGDEPALDIADVVVIPFSPRERG